MNASAATVQQLIDENQGLVHSLALAIHRKLPPHVELDDLVAYGQVGLGEAARDYDPARGSRFSTYAYYRIRGAIYDGLAKMSWYGRAQYHHLRFEHLSNEALQVEDERPPDKSAPAVDDEIRWLRNVSHSLAVVYLATQSRGDSTAGRGHGELAANEESSVLSAAADLELRQRLHEEIRNLPPVARSLIEAVYFEGVTLQEAGARLGYSKSWASRLHARALQELARAMEREGIRS